MPASIHICRRNSAGVAALAACCLLWGFSGAVPTAPAQANREISASKPQINSDVVDFGRDVRPILSDKCFTCHGPDEATREGGFRLDVKEQVFGEAESGLSPVVAGDVENSELLNRIFASDYSQMPPRGHDKQLTTAEKEILRQWIAGGAEWAGHWAFETPRPQEPPACRNTDWPLDPLDQFVLAKLQQRELGPAPRADRRTLIRRASFDLTGLPPTVKDVRQFVDDPADDQTAFARVVDRLLDSPHYGERMASIWLDAARFADTNGYQNDFKRQMWPWRDWVIRAYNSNQPYDEFLVEQLAGDMLENATLQQRIATGFNRNHRTVTEGGSIEQEWLVENVVDRVETTSTVFLGLTMGCARCHDHKYDPISQREFYQFFAYFYNVNERGFHNERRGNVPPLVQVETPEFIQQLRLADEKIAAAQLRLDEMETVLRKQQAEWEEGFGAQIGEQNAGPAAVAGVLTPLDTFADDQETMPNRLSSALQELEDKQLAEMEVSVWGPGLKISGKNESQVDLGDAFSFDGEKQFSVSVWVQPQNFGAILSRMDAASAYRGFDLLLTKSGQLNVHLIHDWPGNAIKITTKRSLARAHWTHVAVTYDGKSKAAGLSVFFNGEPVEFAVNNDNLNGSTLTDHPLWLGYRGFTDRFRGRISQLQFFDSRLQPEQIEELFHAPIRQLIREIPADAADVGARDGQPKWVASRIPAIWRERIAGSKSEWPAQLVADRKQVLGEIYRDRFAEAYAPLARQLKELREQREKLSRQQPTTMVMEEREEPRNCYVLKRGQYDLPDLDQQVFPGIPEFLPQPEDGLPQNRLTLARWMVQPNNPLTARVAINRYWQMLFGRGLLASQENFGVQSPRPLHADMLDYLAVEFQQSGWDVKNMLKRLVTSATYCQSSHAGGAAYAADPANEWLARGPRGRLTAEQIRDNALALAGLLNRQVGGPSIKPYQPDGLWEELAGGAGEGPYVQDVDENLYRRSLYIYRKRTVPHPTMTTFDAGSREICQVSRPRTNTPLQALALLNDPTYVEAARKLTERAIQQAADGRETESIAALADPAMRWAFEAATARRPDAAESRVLASAYARYLKNFAADPGSAKQLLTVGLANVDEKFQNAEFAALTAVCSLILNLDETISKE